jgi:endonuclease-8
MPEGDTIFRAARTMRAALAGRVVTDAWTSVGQVSRLGVRRLVGQTVGDVEPRGKHLLHRFEPSGLVLHTHMRMTGSWHVYGARERWRKPRGLAKFVLTCGDTVAVCFSAPVVELLSSGQVDVHPSLAGLGPDPLAADEAGDVDLAEARRRLDLDPGRAIGEALLDQRVIAGVGNVYKNEVLYLHRVDPWTAVADVDDAVRDALLASSTRLLRENVAPDRVRRVTTGAEGPAAGGDRLYVYGHARRPCRRCGTPIRVARQGEQARLTYWCPRCQGPGPRAGGGRAGRAQAPDSATPRPP